MRSRNSLMRERREAFRDARLIVIASEGKDTERIYFKALLNDYKSQYELEADDELWLVVDKDRWTEAMLSRVATECALVVSMHMALSNPCFELWLLLHLEDAASLTPEEQMLWMKNRRKSKNADPYLKVRLRQKMGSYHEAAYDAEMLIVHVEEAIARAKVLDKNPSDRWPQTLGTRVYLLAESVMNRN